MPRRGSSKPPAEPVVKPYGCDLTASGKSSDLTVPGIWPLCYSWIGYLQANGPPWALRSKSVDHVFTCAHRWYADSPNLEVITAPSGYCQLFTLFCGRKLHSAAFCLIILYSMDRWLSRACRASGAKHP